MRASERGVGREWVWVRFMCAWAVGVCMSVHEGGVKEWGGVLCDGVMRVCV